MEGRVGDRHRCALGLREQAHAQEAGADRDRPRIADPALGCAGVETPHGDDAMIYSGGMRLALFLALVAACGPSSSGGACKDQILAGDLVITEVFADFQAPSGGTGTDTGKEWFEIYNNADHPLDLKGLTIVHSRPDGSKAMEHKMA